MTYEERTSGEIEALLSTASKKVKETKQSLILDPSQKAAIGNIKEWFREGDSLIFVLSGRAGTGKSTIISEVIKELRLREDEVRYLAPTGKAVSVLRSKGIDKAITIHKFIYRFNGSAYKEQEKLKNKSEIVNLCSDGNYHEARAILDNIEESKRSKKRPKLFFASRKVSGLSNLKLLVVDEASMINDEEIDDITNLGIKTIFVGDNAQLPPVEGTNSIMSDPDYELREIHRQGKDSSIIRFANLIMKDPEMKFLDSWDPLDPAVSVIDRSAMDARTLEDFIFSHWQFLTVTNRDKDRINQASRKVWGYDKYKFPRVGEILLAMGGHKDTLVVNGIQGKVTDEFVETEIEHDSIRYWVIEGKVRLLDGTNRIIPVIMRRNSFLSGNLYEFEEGESLWEYGYAMTVHKSQGSSWPKVVYFFDDCIGHLQNLNYTAVTRASEMLTFVKK